MKNTRKFIITAVIIAAVALSTTAGCQKDFGSNISAQIQSAAKAGIETELTKANASIKETQDSIVDSKIEIDAEKKEPLAEKDDEKSPEVLAEKEEPQKQQSRPGNTKDDMEKDDKLPKEIEPYEEEGTLEETNTGATIVVDGKTVSFTNIKPFINEKSGTLYAPVSRLAGVLGMSVNWNPALEVVELAKEDMKVHMKLNYENYNDIAMVTQNITKEDTMPYKPYLKDGEVVVPVRFLAEFMGCNVSWDESSKTMRISDNDIYKAFDFSAALPEGLYKAEEDISRFSSVGKDNKEAQELGQAELDKYKQQCIERVAGLLESINNIDYQTSVLDDQDLMHYKMNVGLNVEDLEKWYKIVKENTIVKESKFITNISKVEVGAMGSFTVKGKLVFKYKEPTKLEFLKQYGEGYKLNQWYSVEVEVNYIRGTRFAGGLGLSSILISKDVALEKIQ